MNKWAILCLLIVFQLAAIAQPAERRITKLEYIKTYKDEAIKGMLEYGIPASITLAQGILESDCGNSALARYASNHFGIKCHKGWAGGTFYQDDDAENECFRKYHSVLESFNDHAEFLALRGRYSFLFDYKTTDYKSWAKGLKKAGYATNPKYPDLLIRIIEENSLDQYDKVKKAPKPSKQLAKAPKKPVPAKTQKSVSASASKPTQIKSNKGKRKMFLHRNKVKFIYAKKGDDYKKIAYEYQLQDWMLARWNETEANHNLKPNEVVFLQPKRKKAKSEFHIVMPGETLWQIAQKHGVKTKHILKRNPNANGAQLQARMQLDLR